MKLIGTLNGIAAFREVIEEYQPEHGVLPKDLIDLVRNTYEFQTYPMLTPGAPSPTVLGFAAGRYGKNGQSVGIQQLVMTPDGDIVSAISTDHADLVLNDLIRVLDSNLGFRLAKSNIRTRYASNIVVEFDHAIEEYIAALTKIENIINEFRPPYRQIFRFKRIAFGDRPDPIVAGADPFATIEQAEFAIERRAGHEFAANRYFCSAPMRTSDHIRVLEQIETTARGN